jgi:hypothetical protein
MWMVGRYSYSALFLHVAIDPSIHLLERSTYVLVRVPVLHVCTENLWFSVLLVKRRDVDPPYIYDTAGVHN